MIKLEQDFLYFVNESKGITLEKKLLSGHVCPHCGQPIHGVFESSSLVDLSKFATPTAKFTRIPTYFTYQMTTSNGQQGQVFFERCHIGQREGIYQSICPFNCIIYRLDHNQQQVLASILSIAQDCSWIYNSVTEQLVEAWNKATPEAKQAATNQFLETLQKEMVHTVAKLAVSQDVTSSDKPPMYLVSTDAWHNSYTGSDTFYNLTKQLNDLTAITSQKELAA